MLSGEQISWRGWGWCSVDELSGCCDFYIWINLGRTIRALGHFMYLLIVCGKKLLLSPSQADFIVIYEYKINFKAWFFYNVLSHLKLIRFETVKIIIRLQCIT